MPRIKLMTKEIRAKLPPIYSTESIPLKDKKVICKFFSIRNSWTWFVVEGEYDAELGTIRFFGYVDGDFGEWGYFTLSELEACWPWVERDMYFKPGTVKDVLLKANIYDPVSLHPSEN